MRLRSLVSDPMVPSLPQPQHSNAGDRTTPPSRQSFGLGTHVCLSPSPRVTNLVGEPGRQLPQRIKSLSTFHALETLPQFLVRPAQQLPRSLTKSPILPSRPFRQPTGHAAKYAENADFQALVERIALDTVQINGVPIIKVAPAFNATNRPPRQPVLKPCRSDHDVVVQSLR
jgi:hypothetical protein